MLPDSINTGHVERLGVIKEENDMVETRIRLRKGFIKKGSPHPTSPKYKFDSAHLTEKSIEKVESRLVGDPKVVDFKRLRIPAQRLLYVKRGPRITPKRPKLRR